MIRSVSRERSRFYFSGRLAHPCRIERSDFRISYDPFSIGRDIPGAAGYAQKLAIPGFPYPRNHPLSRQWSRPAHRRSADNSKTSSGRILWGGLRLRNDDLDFCAGQYDRWRAHPAIWIFHDRDYRSCFGILDSRAHSKRQFQDISSGP